MAFNARNITAGNLLRSRHPPISLDCKRCRTACRTCLSKSWVKGTVISIISLVVVVSVLGGFCSIQYNKPFVDIFFTNEEKQDDDGNQPPIITAPSQSPSTNTNTNTKPDPKPTLPAVPPVTNASSSCPCYDISDVNILIGSLQLDTYKLDTDKSCITDNSSNSKYGIFYERFTQGGFRIEYKGLAVDIRDNSRTCVIEGTSRKILPLSSDEESESCLSLIGQACDSIG